MLNLVYIRNRIDFHYICPLIRWIDDYSHDSKWQTPRWSLSRPACAQPTPANGDSHAIMNAHWADALLAMRAVLGGWMRVIQWDRLDVAFNNCAELAGHV